MESQNQEAKTSAQIQPFLKPGSGDPHLSLPVLHLAELLANGSWTFQASALLPTELPCAYYAWPL